MSIFLDAYIECALWAEAGEAESPIGVSANREELAPETLERMRKDCEAFEAKAGELIQGKEVEAGHDFWLTRRGHGAGFWDGDWPGETAESVGGGEGPLTKLSHSFGDFDLYRGDDGLIYS